MYVCIMYIYVRMYVYICIVYVCMYTYVCMYVRMYVCVYYVCICIYVCITYVHVRMCVFCLKEARGLRLIFECACLAFHPRSKFENPVNENYKYPDDGGT
jgi:nuclear pore complex protein Nup62